MIEYKKTNWQKNTQLSPALFNNIENGISACVEEINKVGEWAKSEDKPKYTADEVGAMSEKVIELHEMNGAAHDYLFTHHVHKADTVEGLAELIEKLDEVRATLSTLKGSVTKLTTRVKVLEEKLKED